MEREKNSKKTNNPVVSIMLGILVLLIMVSAIFLYHVLTIKKGLESQFDEINTETNTTVQEKEEIQIYLPKTCYAAVGLPMEIYNTQVTSQCTDITKYNILWNCDIGENLERKYSLTATKEMIGEYELTLSIYDNALNLLAEKTCILKVVDASVKENFEIYEIRNTEEFSGEEIQADAIEIFFEADNVQDGKRNADSIVAMIEEMKAAGVNLPIYAVNGVYLEEPNAEMLYLMSDLSETLSDYEKVYFVPVAIGVDSEYNYEKADVLKPNEAGYHQIEDMILAVFCGTIEESVR